MGNDTAQHIVGTDEWRHIVARTDVDGLSVYCFLTRLGVVEVAVGGGGIEVERHPAFVLPSPSVDDLVVVADVGA